MKNLFLLIFSIFISTNLILAEEEHLSHNHHAGFFIGAVSNLNKSNTDLSIGLDYEFYIPVTNPKMGIGFIAEIAMAEHTEYILAIPLFIHPIDNFKAFIAPGFLISSHDETHTDETDNGLLVKPKDAILSCDCETAPESHFLFRIGAGYDFHFGRISVSPTIAFDQVQCCAYLVYGISVGVGF